LTTTPTDSAPSFVHEAMIYDDDEQYVAGVVPFVDQGLALGDAVLIAVPSPKLELLRSRIASPDRERLQFVDMEGLGRNPSRIISAWSDFVAEHDDAGRGVRGVGEPIWRTRDREEIDECERHEGLLNLAFADVALHLLCPYESSALDGAVIETAVCNHAVVSSAGHPPIPGGFDGHVADVFSGPLADPPLNVRRAEFDETSMSTLRKMVGEAASSAGFVRRHDDVVLALSEAMSNTVRHGGGRGTVTYWRDAKSFVFEVLDHGRITDPLAGRIRPTSGQIGGRGLWIINQVCDLVQIRVRGDHQVIRMRVGS
jgi:anti-sigma regulatory factor (Ser/Thr protein kinase)